MKPLNVTLNNKLISCNYELFRTTIKLLTIIIKSVRTQATFSVEGVTPGDWNRYGL